MTPYLYAPSILILQKVRRMRSYISVPQHKDDSCSGLGDAGNVDLELLLLNGICISQTGSLTHYIKHT